MESFKKPFRAAPLEQKRPNGLEEPDKPLPSSLGSKVQIDWGLAGLGILIGACVGLAYVFSAV